MFESNISRRAFIAASVGTVVAASTPARATSSRDFSGLQKIIADAVARQDLPFAVAMVADRRQVLWQGVAGRATADREASLDTEFRIFSMTKAIGSLAAMMMVDRKKLSLEAPVTSALPEFGELQVIESVGPSGPILRAPKRPATLKHLLTHTSGLAYNVWNKKEFDWEKATNAVGQLTGQKAGFLHPMAFDPGDDWAYGIGIDWAGFLVQHVDGRSIDKFVREEILEPLGMSNTTFEPEAIRSRLAVTRHRNAQGGFTEIEHNVPSHPEVYGMGQALYSTGPDYIRFLQFILNGTGIHAGHQLISVSALNQMKANQIGSMSVPVMKSLMPEVSPDVDFFPGTRKTWTYGFLRNEVDIPGMRRAGSLTWAGVQNTHYWIDPTQGITAVLMTQTLPFVEPRFMNVYCEFEKHVYKVVS